MATDPKRVLADLYVARSRVNWRTDTVTQLCLAMRQTQDYSACPILADALQDAGFNDVADAVSESARSLIVLLQTETRRFLLEAAVAQLYSDDGIEAVLWMMEFCAKVEYDYETVLNAGRIVQAGGEPYKDKEGYTWEASEMMVADDGGVSETQREYWKHFRTITGLPVPEEIENTAPFECPC